MGEQNESESVLLSLEPLYHICPGLPTRPDGGVLIGHDSVEPIPKRIFKR